MDFDEIDKTKIVTDVMKQRALEANLKAFTTMLDVKTAEAMVKAEIPGASEALDNAKEIAIIEDRRARRAAAAKGVKITEVESNKQKRDALHNWRRQLQAEYAVHEAQAAERTRVLELTGELALTEEEKVRVQANLDSNINAMNQIAAAHGVAKSELNSLGPEESEEKVRPKLVPSLETESE